MAGFDRGSITEPLQGPPMVVSFDELPDDLRGLLEALEVMQVNRSWSDSFPSESTERLTQIPRQSPPFG